MGNSWIPRRAVGAFTLHAVGLTTQLNFNGGCAFKK